MQVEVNNPGRVAVNRCSHYDKELLHAAVDSLIKQLAGGVDFKGKKVLVKPNILFDSPVNKARTTHPMLLEVVIEWLTAVGAVCLFGDSPGLHTPGFEARRCGIREAGERAGGVWVDFNDRKTTLDNRRGAGIIKSFKVAAVVTEVDYIINLPKVKTHQLMAFTCAMKNLFGVIPGLNKSRMHMTLRQPDQFALMLDDLNRLLPPQLIIADGITAMQGRGPANGDPYHLWLLFASFNPFALDWVVSQVIGYPPRKLAALVAASRDSYWLKSVDDIELVGAEIDELRVGDFQLIKDFYSRTSLSKMLLPSFLRRFLRRTVVRPYIDPGHCLRCNKCREICPAKAISVSNDGHNAMIIDYKRCIGCFCCDEICPHGIIMLKKTNIKQIMEQSI